MRSSPTAGGPYCRSSATIAPVRRPRLLQHVQRPRPPKPTSRSRPTLRSPATSSFSATACPIARRASRSSSFACRRARPGQDALFLGGEGWAVISTCLPTSAGSATSPLRIKTASNCSAEHGHEHQPRLHGTCPASLHQRASSRSPALVPAFSATTGPASMIASSPKKRSSSSSRAEDVVSALRPLRSPHRPPGASARAFHTPAPFAITPTPNAPLQADAGLSSFCLSQRALHGPPVAMQGATAER